MEGGGGGGGGGAGVGGEVGVSARVMGSGGGGDSRLKVTWRRRKFHGGQCGAVRDGQRWERMRRGSFHTHTG